MDQKDLSDKARKHMWMHFTRHAPYQEGSEIPVIVSGDGPYVFDQYGKRYIDGLSGLFTCQVGHGRKELGEAAAKQAETLEFFPIWSYANPQAILLAEKLASHAPGDLNRVFFTNGGGEAVESTWKLAKQYFALTGKPRKHKIISRFLSYHGTTLGALSITGVPVYKNPFEPLVPSTSRVPNTNIYRADERFQNDPEAFGEYLASRIEEAILFEGPDTVAAVFLEPVQNSGGCFTPPPGYLQKVREICTKYDVWMVADETITGFGRIGSMFAINRFGVVPDILICAKGLTSGYVPMGAMIVSDRIFEPFTSGTNQFSHGFTYGGHALAAAVALKNIEILENEKIIEHVLANEDNFRKTLEKLYDLEIVGDVRGAGYFYGIELVRNSKTKETFTDEESERLLRGFLSKALFDAGLYCRTDDRGDPVVQLAPPLICTQQQFDEMEAILRQVLTQAQKLMEMA